MNYLNSYNRVTTKRGFKLNPRRVSVQGLRARFLCFFRILRSSYSRALRLVISRRRRRPSSMQRSSSTGSRKSLVASGDARLRSYARSNSFYTEAIAECLEFIKRNSVSADEDEAVAAVRHREAAA